MRTAAVVFLLALCCRAEDWDEISAAVNGERFEHALRLADAARETGKKDGKLAWLRAKAVVGVARDLQRANGYPAALDYLELHLDHELSAYWYGQTCGWAGAELRGIQALRSSVLDPALRLNPELSLLGLLRRYEEIIDRAQEVGGEEAASWGEWASKEAALRDRLAGRARRAWTILVGALLVFGAAVGALFRLSPKPATS